MLHLMLAGRIYLQFGLVEQSLTFLLLGFSEIGIMLPIDQDVDDLYEKLKQNADIDIEQKPQTEVFGRTFLVKDPDGHIIRVC